MNLCRTFFNYLALIIEVFMQVERITCFTGPKIEVVSSETYVPATKGT